MATTSACCFELGDEPVDSVKVYCLSERLLAVQEEDCSLKLLGCLITWISVSCIAVIISDRNSLLRN